MRSAIGKWVIASSIALGMAGMAEAAPVVFTGSDINVGNDGTPRPISDAARAAFDTAAGALGTVNVLNLDSLATGFAANIALGGGVNAALANLRNDSGIRVAPGDSGASGELGFATSGTQFLQVIPDFSTNDAVVTLTFAAPVQAFGAYFSGLESTVDGTVTVNFNDGSSQNLAIPEPGGAGGNLTFFGFTSAGASISSVVVRESFIGTSARDFFGIDDIRFVNSGAAVPIPASAGLGLVGLIGVAGMSYLRRRKQSN